MLSKALHRTHSKHHTPYIGINIMAAVSMLIFAGFFRLKAIDVGRYAATVGTLALLLSYMLTVVCAIVFFHRDKALTGVMLVLMILALLILATLFFLNIYPVPEYPVNLLIYGIFVWLGFGLLLSIRVKTGLSK